MTNRLRLLAGLTAATLLAGCGGVGSSGDQESDGEAGTGVIDTMGFSLQDTIATTRVDAVKEEYPDLEIRVAEGGFDEQQFLSAVASGEPPSLVYLDRTDVGSYAARGALEPLDDCFEQEDIDPAQFREAAMGEVTLDDQVYGVPEFTSVRVMMVDGNGAGFPDPSDWAAMADWSRRQSQGSGADLSRIGLDPKVPEFLPLWVAANGGRLVGDDGRPQLDSPEAVEALEYAVSVVETSAPWAQFKAYRDTWDFFGANNQFVSDQLGAFPMEDWYVDVLAEASPDVKFTTMPLEDREGQPLTWATGTAWAIPKGGSNPEEACRFIKVMTATDTWVAAAEASKAEREKEGKAYTGTFTANVEADQRIFEEVWEPTGHASLDEATQTIREVQDVAFAEPASPISAEIVQAWENATLRVLEGEQTAQEALARAQEEAEQAWERAGE